MFVGRKWACIDFLLFDRFIMIRVSQVGAPILRVVIKWDVRVIVNGAAPHRFRMMIEYNVGFIIDLALFTNILLVDLVREDVILIVVDIIMYLVEGVIQYMWVNIRVGRSPHKYLSKVVWGEVMIMSKVVNVLGIMKCFMDNYCGYVREVG